MIPSRNDIIASYNRIRPYVHYTDVLTSSLLNEISGTSVYFKCENFQKMGAFKMRGAMNAMLQLSEVKKKSGVVTHSSGNFGQAVALAANIIGIRAYVVMPSNSPEVKKRAVKNYGGIVVESKPTLESREFESKKIQKNTGATFLHPSNDLDVILGNATASVEFLEKYPDLDYIFVPVGGGGLLAGTSLATHFFGVDCETIGGEPFNADDAYRSLHSGKIETNTSTNTLADGLRTHLGENNFPIIKKLVKEIIRVEEKEIVDAMKLIWERLKIVIEPSSAVPFAALLREKERFKNKKVGVILSGGNIDFSKLPF